MTRATGSGQTSRELRQSFLDFFAQHDHRVMASAPLKPTDETTLFTSSGMQQFVPWFRGLVPAAAARVATCQKCFRADDIEWVGRTPWHLTFFEMLGNFSFGDYFKQGAIEYGWEYVTEVLGLSKDRLWITVHPDDEESPEIWHGTIGLPRERIAEDATNWWPPGDILGPCGPDTEIYVDTGEERGCGRPDCGPTCGCPRFVEIWNLVFQMYNKTEGGELESLPKAGIDTGMGFERVTAVMQDVPSVFETDLMAPIMSATIARASRSNPKLSEALNEREDLAARTIAEHVRALAFLLADGFTPSNEGAGYVVRRVLRRASGFGRRLGIEESFVYRLVPAVVATMGDAYPELRAAQGRITTWLQQEEKQFAETLERSLGPLMSAIERAQSAGLRALPGEDAFRLHDTYGLPKELAAEIAAESGLELDEEGFEQAMAQQRERGRARAGEDFAFAVRSGYHSFVGKTSFLGYGSCGAEGTVIGIVRAGASVEALGEGEEGEVFLDETPFYAEGGGQVGDRGRLEGEAVRAEVVDTYYPVEGAHAHKVRVEAGELKVGQRVRAGVDEARRQAIARAHTATHLLHHVLRQVLGEHAVQSGSLVDADRLRFDFAHFSALTPEERRQIEDGVVAVALEDYELSSDEMDLDDARRAGATALFGEKYGERVRVVRIGEFSKELCGGTHLPRSSAIGDFAIVSEGSIGAGLRRIEAVTGKEAHALAVQRGAMLDTAAQAVRCTPEDLPERVAALQSELRRAQREVARVQQRSAGALADELAEQAAEIDGIGVLAARVDELAPEALRSLADDLLGRLSSGVVVLGCESKGRVVLVAEVSKDLVAQGYHAGNLAREVARLTGGGGGGRPDFAQAGGRNPERLDEALAKVKELVAAQKA
jgi:alanyl-tRNA synthetase